MMSIPWNLHRKSNLTVKSLRSYKIDLVVSLAHKGMASGTDETFDIDAFVESVKTPE